MNETRIFYSNEIFLVLPEEIPLKYAVLEGKHLGVNVNQFCLS